MARHTTAGRRALHFDSLDEVMPDVDRLLLGHETLGRWSLGQVCNHLSGMLVQSARGFQGHLPWVLRRTVGPLVRRRMLGAGSMPERIKLPEEFWPKPGLDARAEAESLRAALATFAARPDPPVEHPFFGRMTREQWDRLHRIHAAHHLSFVLPTEA